MANVKTNVDHHILSVNIFFFFVGELDKTVKHNKNNGISVYSETVKTSGSGSYNISVFPRLTLALKLEWNWSETGGVPVRPKQPWGTLVWVSRRNITRITTESQNILIVASSPGQIGRFESSLHCSPITKSVMQISSVLVFRTQKKTFVSEPFHAPPLHGSKS